MKYVKYIFLLVISLISVVSIAQVVSVQAKLDSASIKIGQQTALRFEVVQGSESKVQFPLIADSIVSGIDVISISKPDTTILEDGKIRIDANVIISSFDSAMYYIPAFKFFAGADTFETNPLSLQVLTVPVDTVRQPLYDIKPIYNAPINWAEVAWVTFIVLFIVAIVFFLIKYILKKKKTKIEVPEAKIISIPAHEMALTELERIKREKLWQQAKVKEYYTDITTVLRQYIELRYQIPALEMTSDELIDCLDMMRELEKANKVSLKQVLKLADLVKFAKWTPDLNEHDLTLNNAFEFVQNTKEVEIPKLETETESVEKSNS